MMVGVFALTVKGDIENQTIRQREVEASQRFTSVIISVDSNIRAASPQKSQGMNNRFDFLQEQCRITAAEHKGCVNDTCRKLYCPPGLQLSLICYPGNVP